MGSFQDKFKQVRPVPAVLQREPLPHPPLSKCPAKTWRESTGGEFATFLVGDGKAQKEEEDFITQLNDLPDPPCTPMRNLRSSFFTPSPYNSFILPHSSSPLPSNVSPSPSSSFSMSSASSSMSTTSSSMS